MGRSKNVPTRRDREHGEKSILNNISSDLISIKLNHVLRFIRNDKQMPIQKEIIYPFFLECCEFATDTFWKNIFDDLAYGKTPYGTYIKKNFLCCSYKNKEFSYKIERKDPEIIYKDIYSLLTNKLGILSRKEKVKKRMAFHKTESRIKKHRQEWSNIRKKNIKDLLIERYVVDMKQTHDLTLKQTKYLLSLLFMAIVFKVITSKDIDYSDGKIRKIDGIDFVKKKILLRRNIYNIDTNISPEVAAGKELMSDHWEKYLKDLRKLWKNHTVGPIFSQYLA